MRNQLVLLSPGLKSLAQAGFSDPQVSAQKSHCAHSGLPLPVATPVLSPRSQVQYSSRQNTLLSPPPPPPPSPLVRAPRQRHMPAAPRGEADEEYDRICALVDKQQSRGRRPSSSLRPKRKKLKLAARGPFFEEATFKAQCEGRAALLNRMSSRSLCRLAPECRRTELAALVGAGGKWVLDNIVNETAAGSGVFAYARSHVTRTGGAPARVLEEESRVGEPTLSSRRQRKLPLPFHTRTRTRPPPAA
jgi:hypothetical protein